MNKQQAESQGYTFTGHYERAHNHDKIKAEAAALRKAGNKAIVVKVPDSPLSRGSISYGYSIYWIESEVNKKIRKNLEYLNKIKQCENVIAQKEQELLEARAAFWALTKAFELT